jgi:alanine dehydrogenase
MFLIQTLNRKKDVYMQIGIPREIKAQEDRVGLTPGNVRTLVNNGHDVLVEAGAGDGAGFTDDEYAAAGARIEDQPATIWASEMVIKVKEPLASEYDYFHEGLILFAYFHLAPELELTDALLDHKVTAIAYETMVENGSLPLLTPMSEVAGRMAIQIGAHYLEKQNGGSGILLSGVPGVASGHVVVIGGGTVGYNAAKVAVGMGARVTILDVNTGRLAQLEDILNGKVTTLMSNEENIRQVLKDADVVVGSVLVTGRRAPVLVSEEMVQTMKAGSVLVDIAVDQGGNFETSHPTTHQDPVYVKHGVTHYTVANIPGAVPRTSTLALTNATMKFANQIINQGVEAAAKNSETILTGINTYQGHLTHEGVAESQNRDYTPIQDLLNK